MSNIDGDVNAPPPALGELARLTASSPGSKAANIGFHRPLWAAKA